LVGGVIPTDAGIGSHRYFLKPVLLRHSGEGRNPLRSSLYFVIPAKAGTSDFAFLGLRSDAAFVPVGLRPPSLAGESLSLLAQRK
jgi:hypothetical protein